MVCLRSAAGGVLAAHGAEGGEEVMMGIRVAIRIGWPSWFLPGGWPGTESRGPGPESRGPRPGGRGRGRGRDGWPGFSVSPLRIRHLPTVSEFPSPAPSAAVSWCCSCRDHKMSPQTLFFKIIHVQPGDLDHPLHRYPDSILDHQRGELLSIYQYNAVATKKRSTGHR